MPESFKAFATQVTSTNAVSVLTVDSVSTAVLKTLTICNPSTANTASVNITLFDDATTSSFSLFKYTSVSAGQTLMPIATPIVVEPSNEIRISSDGTHVDVVSAYLEVS